MVKTRYRWSDVPALLATRAGRQQLQDMLFVNAWHVLRHPAGLYRRTVAHRTRVIAIVGSLGKSTTTRMATAAVGLPTHRRLLSNAGGAVALGLFRLRPSWPRMVMEIGISGPGQMTPYAKALQPDVAVVTSIASEHHNTFGTLEATREEKCNMVRALKAGGTAVLNGDDANVLWMSTQTRARVVTFGFGDGCDVRATDVRLEWPRGTRFRLHAFGEERDVAIRLLGHRMVVTALAAIAVALVEGIPLDDALARLAEVPPTPGRLEPVALPNGAYVLRDDYKSTIETMHSALDVLAEIPGRRIVVLGDVSEPPAPQRPHYRALGGRVGALASRFVVVSSLFQPYASGARKAGMANDAIQELGRTPRPIADALASILQPGDVLLVKGRGQQRLDRIRLILQGRSVACDIRSCSLKSWTCDICPMLEKGWGTHRAVSPRPHKGEHEQEPTAMP